MRIVVTGASGNVGTSLVEALVDDDDVREVVGIARRLPTWTPAKVTWITADVATDPLERHLEGADAVVHLAWLFQPTHDPLTTWTSNVLGSQRVFDAVAATGVPVLVHASSVGAYTPRLAGGGGPEDRDEPVDETWSTHALPTAAYGREKSYVERLLDIFEREHPAVRVVRMRPAFIFKREASTSQRRIFLGPFVPHALLRPEALRVVPDIPGLRFQALHSDDAAQAYRLAIKRDVRGAFNIAAGPVLDCERLADLFAARLVSMPALPLRLGMAAAWHLRLLPASPHLFDLVLSLPLLDCGRAARELGWEPRLTAVDALRSFFTGIERHDDLATPPLAAASSGPLRVAEIASGVGGRP
jgi:UDP-glucose 4-epimerase